MAAINTCWPGSILASLAFLRRVLPGGCDPAPPTIRRLRASMASLIFLDRTLKVPADSLATAIALPRRLLVGEFKIMQGL